MHVALIKGRGLASTRSQPFRPERITVVGMTRELIDVTVGDLSCIDKAIMFNGVGGNCSETLRNTG